jgi:hypothetical protein
MAIQFRRSRIGMSTSGQKSAYGSYVLGPAVTPTSPLIKAQNFPAWHAKNPGNQVRIAVRTAKKG